MRISLLAIVLTCIFYSPSCHSRPESTNNEQPKVVPPVILRPIDAGWNEHGEISIDSTKLHLPPGNEFSGAQFVDAETGWVFSHKLLFRTTDAAKSWTRLPLVLSEDSSVTSIFFMDRERGWLASHVRLILKPEDSANTSTIFVTSDGGLSWSEQLTFRDRVEIKQLKFFDANRGFVIGSRSKPPFEEIFVAKTTDGGKNWIDISEKLKTALTAGRSPGGEACDLHWLSSNEILLLLPAGTIVATSDGGQTWKTTVRFQDERPGGWVSSTGYYKLVFDPQQRFSVIAGAMGDEGYWGDFVVRNDQNTWLSYELPGVPIFDAAFVSGNEVLACGVELYPSNGKSANRAVGVLLYSSDSGKNWSSIYRSKSPDAFIHLSKIADRQFYAVSDAGTVLRFTLETNKR